MIGRLLLVTTAGFLASAHCIGMCGGFACALAATESSFRVAFARQLVYNVGRIFTYAFLGALAGSLGLYAAGWRLGPLSAQQLFSIVAGAIMIVLGVSTLGLIRLPARWAPLGGGIFTPLFAHFLSGRGWTGHFAAGIANGFLPCGLVYAFLAAAAAAANTRDGLLIMVFFGLGTVPAMLLAAAGGKLLSLAARRRVYHAAAALVVIMGAVTIWRGWPSGPAGCPACGEAPHVAPRD